MFSTLIIKLKKKKGLVDVVTRCFGRSVLVYNKFPLKKEGKCKPKRGHKKNKKREL